MPDVLFVVITVLFFAGAAVFVRACGRIIGPEEAVVDASAPPMAAVPAGDRPVEPVR